MGGRSRIRTMLRARRTLRFLHGRLVDRRGRSGREDLALNDPSGATGLAPVLQVLSNSCTTTSRVVGQFESRRRWVRCCLRCHQPPRAAPPQPLQRPTPTAFRIPWSVVPTIRNPRPEPSVRSQSTRTEGAGRESQLLRSASNRRPMRGYDTPMADLNRLAHRLVKQATEPSEKPSQAQVNGRKGGLNGGKARTAKLTPKRRSEIARKAALARWEAR